MSKPEFCEEAYQQAHVVLDYLVEHQVPLSADAMQSLDLLAWSVDGALRDWFKTAARWPRCPDCYGLMAASRTVETREGPSTRYLFDCGFMRTLLTRPSGLQSWENLAPCAKIENEGIRREEERTARIEAAQQAFRSCEVCGGTGSLDDEAFSCDECEGTGQVQRT